ncbi:MAG: hypothetical protein ABFS12_16680 [Bacteroidota bacterium]
MPNKLSQFWQELKRRNVHRLLAIYAGTAYVIFEASTIIFPRWGLPDWTIDLVLYLLILGAVITFAISWIYDITPEGIEKTKPAIELQKDEKTAVSSSWRFATYVSVVIIMGLIAFNIFKGKNAARIDESLSKSIAVLPFINDSPDEANQYFINGTMDAILDNLCRIHDLKVIARTSSEKYRGGQKLVTEVARELSVSYILEGSGQRYGDKIRLTVQLINGKTGIHLWSRSYDRDLEDIFDIQSEIAQLVAGEIKAIISPEEKVRIEKIPTGNMEAYNEFLVGKYFYDNQHTLEGFQEALRHLKRAIQLDTTFALAYFYTASSYQFMVRYNWIHSDSVFHDVRNAIMKTIELDETLGEAYAALGLFKIVFEWNLYGPDEDFRKALKLNPNSAEIYALYAQYLRWMRRFAEGKVMAKRAIELDPVTPITNLWLGAIFFYEGEYDKSIDHLNQTLKLDSNFIYTNAHLAYAYIMKADTAKALYYAGKAMSENVWNTSAVGSMGWVYAKCGATSKAKEILNRLIQERPDQPIYQAMIYSGLGEYKKTLDLIYQAYERRSGTIIYLYAFSSTFFKDMREEPRFINLLQKIGFRVN